MNTTYLETRERDSYDLHTAPSTLMGYLSARALHQPKTLAYIYLSDGETEGARLNYSELDGKARTIAALLQTITAPNQRALLIYPPGLEFITAFFGCLYAGIIAVPAYPPHASHLERTFPRLQAIADDASPSVVLTTASIMSKLEKLASHLPCLAKARWIATDELDREVADEWREPEITPDSIAFLQYTSGSTSKPKGVMVTHGNLLHNQRLIRQACLHTHESTFVGWLPLYHDMGLIGNVLQPLYLGALCVLMSPAAFLQKPFRWLQAVSRYQGATSGGPNFAYDLCARKISSEQRATLDLSSWTVAFNGAEPVRSETMERFAEIFAPCGFRKESFYPCYGLAEATLFVSGGLKTAPPVINDFKASGLEHNRVETTSGEGEDTRRLVSCGKSSPDQKIAVVNVDTLTRCPPGQVGEIWVSGASVAQGYWGHEEDTEKTFHAYLADTGEGPFLRTGDMGFLDKEELFVTGRIKDLIIIRGRNHYPQDIELTVEHCHPALRPGCGAVFSVELEGEERLVVVQEFDDKKQADPAALIELVRQKVSESHEVQAHAVVLIKAGTIPKTSSGKIQRHACKEKYLKAELETIKTWHCTTGGEAEAVDSIQTTHLKSAGEILDWLLSNSAAVLRVNPDQLDLTRPIAQYGLDSLAAVELAQRIEEEFGMALPPATMLQDISISLLASQIRRHLTEPASDAPTALTGDQNPLGEHPLSYGQKSLWFLHQLAPDSPAYNIATAFRIESHLDARCLQSALETLVQRHASLRTTFRQSQDQPVQVVQAGLEVCFDMIEASGWEDELLDKHLAEEAARLFDLNKGPLFRATLYRKSDSSYIMQWVLHHIIADLWSLGVLMQEFWTVYRSELEGGSASLSQPSVDYVSYSRWEAQQLAGIEGERLWDYWQKQLGGELPVLNLPTDKPRPAVQTFNGASESFQLDSRLTGRLKSLAREQGATLYMTLLACFFALLHRYTQQDDILVGTPTNGRDRADLKGLVGYLVNPLPLRADFSSEPTFEEFLAQVRRTALDALSHQSYPLALLAERLQPERDPSRSPLFQSMFVFQKSHLRAENEIDAFALGEEHATLRLGGLRMESITVPQPVAQFDLMLTMTESEGGLSASLQYNTDLFERDTTARMAVHFQSLVESVVAAPHARVSELSILDGAERARLLFEWNETATPFPETAFVPRLIEAQAARTPGAVALAFEGAQLTYAEMNEQANRLANYLRSLGVGAETLVGIFMERSLELVIAILGTLKAGAAYVPLDPSHPKERLALMLDGARPPVVLTQGGLRSSIPNCEAQTFCLDTDWHIIAAYDGGDPVVDLKPDNLAYVIYTSGSTGQPKGAMNTHAGIANRLLWMQQEYGLGAGDAVLQKTPFTFDVSVWEFLWPLMTGARLVVARPGGHQDSAYLVRLIDEQQITTIHFVPSMLQAFLREEGVESCTSLKRVICSGEALSASLQERFFARLGAELHNLYGPTEAAIDVTYWACRRDDARRSVPIGRPIANTQVYLLDKNLQPVPAGVGGELHIGGINLARGYLGQPALTAEKFIPHALASEAGQRLYKTGDLARYRADGVLEFLGRIDHQVKIRGVRIEVEEIETQLNRHPAVKDAVVVAGEAASGDKRLVAYVVGRSAAETPTAVSLRQFLKQRLPDAMVPAVFVVLDELPLHPNGKVNRRALPEPESQRPELDKAYMAPRSEVERQLADIWRHLLGLERVGTNDDFFELGGHSLLATQLISRIRAAFNLTLPLEAVFKNPTVAALSERIEPLLRAGAGQPVGNGHALTGDQRAMTFKELLSDDETSGHQAEVAIALSNAQPDNTSSVPPLKAVTRGESAPLSFAQQRLWFLDQLAPGRPDYNMPGVVRLTGELNVEALEKTLNEIVRRHEILRTTFSYVGGHPVQVIQNHLTLRLPITNLRENPASEIDAWRIIAEETRRPFDLATGPLMRAQLLRLGAQSHLLLLVLHHIVCDGWSRGLLLAEMSELYAAFSKQALPTLAEPAIQYADYALWQHDWLQGEMLEEQLDYWRRQLGGTLPVLELPADHPRATAHETKGDLFHFTIPEDLTAAINTLSKRQGTTLFMTLLAAFKVLLYRYTGQTDVMLGSPIANRNRIEVESLIGFFVNTLVLRTDLTGDPTFVALLERVKQTALDAYQHQDLPFEKLVEEIQPDREIDRNALFQVMFILQNAPASTLSMPGLKAETLDVGNGASIFDLTLYVEECTQVLKCAIEYKSDLFERASISRMAEHFSVLLHSIVTAPGQHISSIPLLGAAEREEIIHDFNRVAAEPPVNACIHHLVEHQVARRPDALAVVDHQEQLTYRELNSRANQLARRLQSAGVGPDTLVGLCLNRSAQMLVGLLAILKAGGAYVPLDPSYPRERLSLMLSDAGLNVLLTEKALESLFTGQPPKTICIDRDESTVAPQDSRNVESAVQPQNLAYVIYTSGSTGKPKGVMIPHHALVDHCLNVMRRYEMQPDDKVLQVASISFDVAAEEIFPTWLSGATVVMPSESVLAGSSSFAGLLEEHRITLTNISATHWSELVNELDASGSSIAGSLRLMVTGVEKVPVERLAVWQEVGGAQIPFINTYGPTEATIGATMYQLDEEDQRGKNWSWVPIGKPVGRSRILILDEHLKPVPVGVVGEIYIGGERLARGYLGHADVTAEKFIPDPFGRSGGERLYRTGDLGRYLRDGNIEFSGRIDQQVKIRGYRVELGEIEAALMQHESVAECVVLAREDTLGDKRLVAYVVPNLQYLQNGDGGLGKDLVPEHVSQWESVFDDLFDKIIEDDEQKATFYVKGWNSSYTDEQIPEEEIREWTNNTVNRILDLSPKRVLEIGSGSGLMLFRIGPHCEQYCATDLAESFIPMLEKQLAVLDEKIPGVSLMQRAADDFSDLPEDSFDAVLISSVVQYFPSIEYLMQVLEGALRIVEPGGFVFVGDVRNLALLEAFHASVQLYRAAAGLSVDELRRRVKRQMRSERQLVIDPTFFMTLHKRLNKVREVEVQLLRGRHHNEEIKYRYDVIIHVGSSRMEQPDLHWLDWEQENLGLESLRQHLAGERPERLGVGGVPNARLLEDLKILDWLDRDQPATVSDIRRAMKRNAHAGIEPEDFWRLGEELGYDVDVTWADTGAEGRFDAVFTRRKGEPDRSARAFYSRLPKVEKPLREYANDPLKIKYEAGLQNKFAPKAVPELRSHLRERLPDYMLPSAFVIMDGLPVTANGKIDRQALPAPDKKRPELEQEYKTPRNEVEQTLAQIWSEVLGVERVGIEDNFFDLGGHSLLAIQIMSRVSETFNADVPLRTLFEEPTVAGLARVVEQHQSERDLPQPPQPPKLSKLVDSLEQQLANLMQLPDEQVNSQLAVEEQATPRRGMK